MHKNRFIKPIVKWLGGKRQLLTEIKQLIPDDFTYYYEPFLGGGAVLFALQPTKAIVNDMNQDLINLYRVVQENVEELIHDLKKHKNEKNYYYQIRALDRDLDKYNQLSVVERASRMLYLNKTSYNGLYRVNSSGQFNAPFGRYKRPNIVNDQGLKAVNFYFNQADIYFKCGDFADAVECACKDSFIYFDPPYDPVSTSANFTSYARKGFNKQEQIRLKELCDELTSKKVRFLLSNSATSFILDLYKEYQIEIVTAGRTINCHGDKRGAVKEVLVRNFD